MGSILISLLGVAVLIAVIASFWYLFQTLRVMWGYNFLIAIAAVIFSPLVHIIFYFFPKDGFDSHKRGMFKKYLLSFAMVFVFGVMAALISTMDSQNIIDAIGDENHTSNDVYISDRITEGEPWDWDIRSDSLE